VEEATSPNAKKIVQKEFIMAYVGQRQVWFIPLADEREVCR